MPNPKGINQYTKGGKSGKSAKQNSDYKTLKSSSAKQTYRIARSVGNSHSTAMAQAKKYNNK